MNHVLNVPTQPIGADRQRATASVPLLSHLRWLAAFVVVASHVEQSILAKGGYVAATGPVSTALETKPLLGGYGGYGHAAVVVFFVLSGFLVGGKLVELLRSPKLRTDWPSFLVDRFSRIFIVLWPTLLLNGVIMAALISCVPDAPFVQTGHWTFDLTAPLTADLTWPRWAAAAVMLNDLLVPTLNSNGPLWSLAYEWSYYVIGLAAVLAYRRVFSPWAVVVIAYGIALLTLSALNQPNILFAGLSWLAGVGARLVFNAGLLRGWVALSAGPAAFVLVLVLDHWVTLPDPVLGVAVALMIAHPAWRRWRWGDGWGERLASFSYTLYAMHFPVLVGIMGVMYAAGVLPSRLPFNMAGLAIWAGVVAVLVVAARLFARITEDHTIQLRRRLLLLLGLRRERVGVGETTSAGSVRVHTVTRP